MAAKKPSLSLPVTQDLQQFKNKQTHSELQKKYLELQQSYLELEKAYELLNTPVSIPPTKQVKSKSKQPIHEIPVLCINDLHIGASIDPRVVSRLNKSHRTPEDVSIKLEEVFEKAVEVVKKRLKTVPTMVMFLGGDLLENYLGAENREINTLAPLPEMLLAFEWLTRGITFILDELKVSTLKIICSFGNHGRSTDKPRTGKTAWRMSYEWALYKLLEKHFLRDKKDSRVIMDVQHGVHTYVDINGWTIRFQHGDLVRDDNEGDLAKAATHSRDALNKNIYADYDVFAHQHRFMLDLTNRWLSLPALCGIDAFGVGKKYTAVEPMQLLFFVSQRRPIEHFELLHVSDGYVRKGRLLLPSPELLQLV